MNSINKDVSIERYYGFDAARAFFLLLGVAYHLSLPLLSDYSWLIHLSDEDGLYSIFALFIRDFRMFGFFIIAGFFFNMLLDKDRPLAVVIKDRVQRVVIPLFFIGLTLNVWVAVFYETDLFSNELNVSFFTNGIWVGHLWFISNLLFYYVIFYLYLFRHKKMRLESNLPVLIFVYFLLVPISSLGLQFLVKITNLNGVFVLFSPIHLAKFFPYFFFGMVFWVNRGVLLRVLNRRNSLYLLLAYFLVKSIVWLVLTDKYQLVVVNAFAAQFITASFIGFFNAYFTKENKMVSGLVDASYTIYLLHHPMVIVFVAFASLYSISANLYFSISLILICTITYLSHSLVVKKNRILEYLFNGKSLR